MPTYKVVLFHSISDIPQQQYMNEQKRAIQNSISNLEVEVADSTDFRLALYSSIPNRMPAVLILKDGARMQIKHAKLGHPEAVNWIRAVTQ